MKLLKIPYTDPLMIFKHYDPSDEIQCLVNEELTPFELIKTALDKELYHDVILFLAHAMPVRETVWWAASCASTRKDWNENEWNAVNAAKAWVNVPDEISRRYAEEMAKKTNLQTAASWAAMSAFWSGGSMTAEKDPVVPPPAYLYAKAAAGCVSLCALLTDENVTKENYKTFIAMGIDIANGGNGATKKGR